MTGHKLNKRMFKGFALTPEWKPAGYVTQAGLNTNNDGACVEEILNDASFMQLQRSVQKYPIFYLKWLDHPQSKQYNEYCFLKKNIKTWRPWITQ